MRWGVARRSRNGALNRSKGSGMTIKDIGPRPQSFDLENATRANDPFGAPENATSGNRNHHHAGGGGFTSIRIDLLAEGMSEYHFLQRYRFVRFVLHEAERSGAESADGARRNL